jgi:uncharacterized protein YjbJ (UPF0337 family)
LETTEMLWVLWEKWISKQNNTITFAASDILAQQAGARRGELAVSCGHLRRPAEHWQEAAGNLREPAGNLREAAATCGQPAGSCGNLRELAGKLRELAGKLREPAGKLRGLAVACGKVLQPLMKPFQNLGKLFLTFLLVFPE